MLAAIFDAAGVPEGVLQMLPGEADVGAALVANQHARVIAFTGSTAAGRKVGEAAARHLKRAHLELGGNNALIVMPDADIAAAASAGAWGTFLHQGQICMTSGRHIVHESVADEYVAELADKARSLTVGNPYTDQVALGPNTRRRSVPRDHGRRDRSTSISPVMTERSSDRSTPSCSPRGSARHCRNWVLLSATKRRSRRAPARSRY